MSAVGFSSIASRRIALAGTFLDLATVFPTPQPAPNAISGIREFSPGGPGAALRGCGCEQLAVQPPEGFGRPVVGAEPQHEASARLDQPAGSVDQLLHP